MAIFPDINTALSGALTVGAGGSQIDDTPRVPTTFTSSLRLRALAPGFGIGRDADDAAELIANFPFLTSPVTKDVIAMELNPKSVRFSQPKRIKKTDTMEGSAFFHFSNKKGQNDDILVMAFTGNTGNIDLRGSLGGVPANPKTSGDTNDAGPSAVDRSGPDTGALAKWLAWHNLYALTREPVVLPDGTENDFIISFSSRLFPFDIVFHGFFSKNMEWDENAQKPNSRDYTFEFTATSSEPELDELLITIGDIMATPPGNPTVANIETGAGGATVVP